MRKESETLLKIIGTDAEYGTHGSIPYHLALANSIARGEDKHNLFVGINLGREDYRLAMMELPPFFNQMSEPSFSRLMSIAQKLEFHTDREVGETVKRGGILDPYFDEQIVKRAKLLQTFSDMEPPLYDYGELMKEEKVREKCPWQWIDAVKKINFDAAREEMIKILVSPDPDHKQFLNRIPYIRRKIPGGEEHVDYIMERLDGMIPTQIYQVLSEHIARSRSTKEHGL